MSEIEHLLKEASGLYRSGRMKEAVVLGRRILDAQPAHGGALLLMGRISLEAGKPGSAADLFAMALDAGADKTEGLLGLGCALMGEGRIEEAMGPIEEALAVSPGLGVTELEAVTRWCRDVLEENPDLPSAHFVLGQALKAFGRFDEALLCHRRALRFDASYARKGDSAEAVRLLSQGEIAKGWLAFEWRSTIGGLGPFTEMVWDGSDLEGKTVVVWGEQGIGDQIMFANCIPDLTSLAGRVVIETDSRLTPLFARSFPSATVAGETRFTGAGPSNWQGEDWRARYPDLDVFVLEGSLPRFLRPSLACFPSDESYLVADPDRVAFWRDQLEDQAGKKTVGVSWRSLHMTEQRSAKYPPLDTWAPLFALDGIRFVSIQANMGETERRDIEGRFGIDLLVPHGLDLNDDLDDTAALLCALDAVVSADTYIPMMAGGLGVPVWRITRGVKEDDWSFLGAERYPWFPSMTVLFGESEKELRAVFQAVAEDLNK